MDATMKGSLRALGVGVGCAVLLACGGDGGSGSRQQAPAIQGTAAVGAPVAGATVSVRCGGFETTVQSTAQGNFSVARQTLEDGDASFPCALKVDSSLGALFSYAPAAGVTNITPLTTLAVGRAASLDTGATPADWFDGLDDESDLTGFAGALTDVVDALEAALAEAAGETSLPFDIFSTTFRADGRSTYDVWLDRFSEALVEAGQTYADFASVYFSQSQGDSFGPTFVIDLSQGPSLPGGGGEYDLHVTVTVMGQSTTTVVEGVPKPDDMSAFCAGEYAEYIGEGGSLTITECSFSGTQGVINATVASGSFSLSYQAVYEWK